MDIRIPEEDIDTVAAIAKLSAPATDEFVQLLREQPIQLYAKDNMGQAVARTIKLTPAEDASSIVDVLFSMYQSMCAGMNVSAEEFATGVIKEISTMDEVDAFPSADLVQLKENLIKLLSVNALAISAKAVFLHLENDRNLISSKVITDARPVFDPNSSQISAMVLVHSLKLTFIDTGGNRNEFSVAMDNKDINTLILNLERAKMKTDSMREFTSRVSVPFLENDEK